MINTNTVRTIPDKTFRMINRSFNERSEPLDLVMRRLFGEDWFLDCVDEAKVISVTIMMFLAVPEAESVEMMARYRNPTEVNPLYDWCKAFDVAELSHEQLAACAVELGWIANP